MDETESAFDRRLCEVIAEAETTFYRESYRWRPIETGLAPSPDALAVVRDDDSWCEFVPAGPDDGAENFRVVRFNFSETGPSAIGFVAWLHTHLRLTGRTGAIVICGKDKRNSDTLFEICQGAMDYWACPVGDAADRFIQVIRSLIEKGRT